MNINDYLEGLRNRNTPIIKKLVKKGTVKRYCAETTPIIWKDKLLRFEWIRNGDMIAGYGEGALRFINMEDESEVCVFGEKHSFGCCYAENDVMYVCGTYVEKAGDFGGRRLDMLWSSDLENWESKTIFEFPSDVEVFNTSLCKGENEYILAIEIGGSSKLVGEPYTIIFAKSTDLFNWELLSPEEHTFSRDKYTACPSVRYFDGFYYMVYLEALPYYRSAPFIVRTKDFENFEVGLRNPFMMFDDDDKKILYPDNFTDEEKEMIFNASNNNNSDVDFCEYKGKTIITYSWGNQLGKEYIAIAEYDGGLEELLKSYFN